MSKIPANSTIGNLFVWPFCCVPADRDGCKVRCCITAISFWKHKMCYYINCLTPNRLNSHEGVFASCAQTERGHIGFLVQCTLHPVLLRYTVGIARVAKTTGFTASYGVTGIHCSLSPAHIW